MPAEDSTSPVIRTGFVQLSTGLRPVQYADIDGEAVFEGDIILGTVEDVEGRTEMVRGDAAFAEGIAVSGDQFRWPNCTIPYTIDPNLPAQHRVTDAIAHWEQKTNFRFVKRTNEPDWVSFRPSTRCSSMIGRRGGLQIVDLGPDCGTGNAIHEIGHVVGLWHEQSREDRDRFIRINWAKIRQGSSHNFNQHITDGDDVGAYDYASIMHYAPNAFSATGEDTITPLDPNAQIGQRDGLSAGDIEAANSLCKKASGRKIRAVRS